MSKHYEEAGQRAYALKLAMDVGSGSSGRVHAVRALFEVVSPWLWRDDGDVDMGF